MHAAASPISSRPRRLACRGGESPWRARRARPRPVADPLLPAAASPARSRRGRWPSPGRSRRRWRRPRATDRPPSRSAAGRGALRGSAPRLRPRSWWCWCRPRAVDGAGDRRAGADGADVELLGHGQLELLVGTKAQRRTHRQQCASGPRRRLSNSNVVKSTAPPMVSQSEACHSKKSRSCIGVVPHLTRRVDGGATFRYYWGACFPVPTVISGGWSSGRRPFSFTSSSVLLARASARPRSPGRA